jgi:enamine deaminase RidA (YjgF/YER057c/UK114 family)
VTIEARLEALGMVLPPASEPSHAYVHVRQVGNLLFVAGHSPKRDGKYPYLGKLGAEVTIEQGQECARNCVVNCLASAKQYVGDLGRVKGVVKLVGYVASAPTFTQQPQVINAASDLLIAAMGDAGRHARTSVGVAVLPGDIPVEIEMILEIEG